MLWAEVDSMHVSVCMLLKVLLPVKAEKFERIDNSLIITRNYFHAWITLLNMGKQLYLKNFPFVCIFFYLMPFFLLLLNAIQDLVVSSLFCSVLVSGKYFKYMKNQSIEFNQDQGGKFVRDNCNPGQKHALLLVISAGISICLCHLYKQSQQGPTCR